MIGVVAGSPTTSPVIDLYRRRTAPPPTTSAGSPSTSMLVLANAYLLLLLLLLLIAPSTHAVNVEISPLVIANPETLTPTPGSTTIGT